jgi:chemotaxis protein histidine kinase CheA
VLDRGAPQGLNGELPVIVLGEREQCIGLLVDRFTGERELVVLPLDPKLGKLQDIAAGALMEEGAPVLLLDVDDVLRSAGLQRDPASGGITRHRQRGLRARAWTCSSPRAVSRTRAFCARWRN